MRKKILATSIAAALAAGAYVTTDLLPMFAQFAKDIAFGSRIGSFFETPSGGEGFFFVVDDSLGGRWLRELPPRYTRDGTLWIDNVRADLWSAPPDSSVLIIPTEPVRIRVRAQVNGSQLSSDLFLVLEGTVSDSTIQSAPDPPDPTDLSTYIVEVRRPGRPPRLDYLEPGVGNTWEFPPGQYELYFAAVDSLEIRTDFIGPLMINSGGL